MKTQTIEKLGPSATAVGRMKVLILAAATAGLQMGGMISSPAAETNATPGGMEATGSPLRVGVAPDYEPLAFRQPDGLAGLEIDFAKVLGQELDRPVQLVVLDRDQLINSLLAQRVDIIMSGISVTKARQLRAAFCDPYVTNQLRAIFPVKSAGQFNAKTNVLNTTSRIGVITGTTADAFVKQNCPSAKIVNFTDRENIPFYLLKGNRMDLFVDDTFALAPMYAKNEADMAYLPEALSEDNLAWAVRPGDTQFLDQLNAILGKWKSDGTLDRMLNRWLPYLKNLQAKPTADTPK